MEGQFYIKMCHYQKENFCLEKLLVKCFAVDIKIAKEPTGIKIVCFAGILWLPLKFSFILVSIAIMVFIH